MEMTEQKKGILFKECWFCNRKCYTFVSICTYCENEIKTKKKLKFFNDFSKKKYLLQN